MVHRGVPAIIFHLHFSCICNFNRVSVFVFDIAFAQSWLSSEERIFRVWPDDETTLYLYFLFNFCICIGVCTSVFVFDIAFAHLYCSSRKQCRENAEYALMIQLPHSPPPLPTARAPEAMLTMIKMMMFFGKYEDDQWSSQFSWSKLTTVIIIFVTIFCILPCWTNHYYATNHKTTHSQLWIWCHEDNDNLGVYTEARGQVHTYLFERSKDDQFRNRI